MKTGATRKLFCGLVLGAVGVSLPVTYATADPITSIFVNYLETSDQPLNFVFDKKAGEGFLSVDIESFSVLVERLVAGETVVEFINDASFHFQAQMLTDTSAGTQASGVFAAVEFELLDAGLNLLLAGANLIDANVAYTESGVPDVFLIESGEVPITGGSLATDFEEAAILAGIGFFIQPGTAGMSTLDTDHSGAINLSINAVPEPASAVLLACALAGLSSARRRCRERVVRATPSNR